VAVLVCTYSDVRSCWLQVFPALRVRLPRTAPCTRVLMASGYHGDNQDPDILAQEADKIGYPVLIKAIMVRSPARQMLQL
jgi:formate-dependent phosphoribosylglycinamide formyltransferase (GAR transformylase)